MIGNAACPTEGVGLPVGEEDENAVADALAEELDDAVVEGDGLGEPVAVALTVEPEEEVA